MNTRRFFDHIQLNLHLLGFHRLAAVMGRFGTPALTSGVDEHDRPTLPYGIMAYRPEAMGVPGHFYDESSPTVEKMKVVDYDPMFDTEVVLPYTKLDIN